MSPRFSPQEGAQATDVGGSAGEAGEGGSLPAWETPSGPTGQPPPTLAALAGGGNDSLRSLGEET